MSTLFDNKVAEAYDARNGKLNAITDTLHFLIQLVLQPLPANARVLCVGAGTGAEILKLAALHPDWHFTALEPSAPMLAICKAKIAAAGLNHHCEFFEGYLDAFPKTTRYDAVLALLVTQFLLNPDDRQSLFTDMASRLTSGGYLINAEICGNMTAPGFTEAFRTWQAMHHHAGTPPENLPGILTALQQHVAVVPPAVIEDMLRHSGLPTPVRFFQSLLIHAWHARKP